MEENTLADSIAVGVPRNADKALMAIRESNGLVVNVFYADTAEDAVLVRVYEAMGMETETAVHVHLAVKRCLETDMLEENGQTADLGKLHFKPFEIKTFLLHL